MSVDEEFRGLPIPSSILLPHPPGFAIFDQNGVPLDVAKLDPRIDPMVLIHPKDSPALLKWGEQHVAAILTNEALPLWERQYFLHYGLVLQAGRLFRYRARFARVQPLLEILQLAAAFVTREPSSFAASLSMMVGPYRTDSHAAGTGLLAAALLVGTAPAGSLAAPILAAPMLSGMVADVGLVESHRDLLSFERAMTPPERNILHAHPHSSSQLARRIGLTSERILEGIESHHERIDGSGYPLGLGGDMVPRLAQCVALADTYLTLITERPRTEALSRDDALQAVSNEVFSRELVEALARLVRSSYDSEAELMAAMQSVA